MKIHIIDEIRIIFNYQDWMVAQSLSLNCTFLRKCCFISGIERIPDHKISSFSNLWIYLQIMICNKLEINFQSMFYNINPYKCFIFKGLCMQSSKKYYLIVLFSQNAKILWWEGGKQQKFLLFLRCIVWYSSN